MRRTVSCNCLDEPLLLKERKAKAPLRSEHSQLVTGDLTFISLASSSEDVGKRKRPTGSSDVLSPKASSSRASAPAQAPVEPAVAVDSNDKENQQSMDRVAPVAPIEQSERRTRPPSAATSGRRDRVQSARPPPRMAKKESSIDDITK